MAFQSIQRTLIFMHFYATSTMWAEWHVGLVAWRTRWPSPRPVGVGVNDKGQPHVQALALLHPRRSNAGVAKCKPEERKAGVASALGYEVAHE